MVSEQITAPPPRGRLSRGSRPNPGPGAARRAAADRGAGRAGLRLGHQPGSARALLRGRGPQHVDELAQLHLRQRSTRPGTITLDKLPGAFWVQALAVRAFGVHTWVIVLPQAVEGVLTVLVLYRAVRRLAGPAAGLIAAAVLA